MIGRTPFGRARPLRIVPSGRGTGLCWRDLAGPGRYAKRPASTRLTTNQSAMIARSVCHVAKS